jgi:hypothetical protein
LVFQELHGKKSIMSNTPREVAKKISGNGSKTPAEVAKHLNDKMGKPRNVGRTKTPLEGSGSVIKKGKQ